MSDFAKFAFTVVYGTAILLICGTSFEINNNLKIILEKMECQ
jgi:hypothetical protein